MFNYWKDFIAFRATIEEDKLGRHLEELDVKHKAQVRAKKMIAERKRLARITFEKRKREKEKEKMMAGTEITR